MDVTSQLLLIFLGLFLVFLNGFFVASEFSIVKVRATRIGELVQQGARRADTAEEIVGSMDEYLSATQLGITVASLALGWVGEPAFAALFEPAFAGIGAFQPVITHSLAAACAFLLITFLHIVLGELAPKSLAIRRSEATLLWAAAPLNWFYKISYPFNWLLNGTANKFLRMAGLTPMAERELAHSEEELRLILAESHAKGVLGRDERRMLERVLDFTERSVRQVMVPSVEVVFLDVQKSLEENLQVARQHRHTRYPLCDGSLDRVVGLVHVKELFWKYYQLGGQFTLDLVKRPVQFVPDSKYIQSLLTEFRRTRSHLAIVVDEHGATVGMVTLEDILEELVGEIQDEFDIEIPTPMIQKLGDHQYLVQGRTLLEEIKEDLEIPIHDEENDTMAGHVMMLLGRAAEVGDEVVIPAYRVRVVGMKGLQITDLLLERLPEESG